MKRSLVLATALCTSLVTGALAHETAPKSTAPTPAPASNTYSPSATNNVGARSTAGAVSGAVSGSVSRSSSKASTGPSSAQASNAGNTMNYNGGGYSARGNNPDVILGSVSGGNPCGLGAGAGGSGFSLAAIFQMMWEGAGCQRNEDTKLLHNMGFSNAAIKNRLCEGSKYRDAFKQAGEPCEVDRTEMEAAWTKQGYHQRADGYWVQ